MTHPFHQPVVATLMNQMLLLENMGRFEEAIKTTRAAFLLSENILFLNETASLMIMLGDRAGAVSLTRDQKHPCSVKIHAVAAALLAGQSKVTVGGLTFQITGRNWELEGEWLAGKPYEPEETELIASFMANGRDFIDVGANAGCHTMAIAKRFPQSTVFPVEPEPTMARTLAANAELNGLTNIDFRGVGKACTPLGEPASLQFRSSASSTRETKYGGFPVPGVSLRELLSEKTAVVKLDAEGAEVNIIRSCEKELADLGVVVVAEDLLGEGARGVCEDGALGKYLPEVDAGVLCSIPMHAGRNVAFRLKK